MFWRYRYHTEEHDDKAEGYFKRKQRSCFKTVGWMCPDMYRLKCSVHISIKKFFCEFFNIVFEDQFGNFLATLCVTSHKVNKHFLPEQFWNKKRRISCRKHPILSSWYFVKVYYVTCDFTYSFFKLLIVFLREKLLFIYQFWFKILSSRMNDHSENIRTHQNISVAWRFWVKCENIYSKHYL